MDSSFDVYATFSKRISGFDARYTLQTNLSLTYIGRTSDATYLLSGRVVERRTYDSVRD